ncbi:putative sugar nucleotidyl transferase [Pseudobacter ginsenosidimutans]|uniref:UDP-N-acetylglucosamine diphosphorylase/glucosamine-1-phosphate N-acetyltransferase n=1 Tax=Pseudobacter ginsenosidimutans TaxID=661488 RepID=A0A4Q7N404_9BACT|nr:putative sugar nucleotidyl transferase [Pseudobacter ginsenosidimutans]QEC44250.1 glucose-1-phosphate thymidylyltransferase [Pseudobacter ginsenosidimutans]RZS75710.1 UDP-N-acetylglucosamine diphosphorylase/glucosamine-1-phosphate N-acetyltransferase [Pseudobacter ginsenosidimutans]
MQVYLNESEVRDQLFPFSQVRSVPDIRVGILTIREKWEMLLGYPVQLADSANGIPAGAQLIAANIIPTKAFVASLKTNPAEPDWESVRVLQYPWHIFQFNDWAIREDFELITADRSSTPVRDTSVQAINPSQIFIEPGARLQHCILNAATGPIYIGRNAEIMEGSLIRGPFALGEDGVVKMGAKIYGATTIGPGCVAGGEIKNSVMMGYSNKAHDGYLGDAVLGEWCNLGAGTSNSNLKNNASDVKVWHQPSKQYLAAGIKCGLLMGDYSRAAINTSFYTGTVVGICANVFGDGIPPRFVPSFTWGNKGLSKYEFEKALTDIEVWKKFKHQHLTEEEIKRLRTIFEGS